MIGLPLKLFSLSFSSRLLLALCVFSSAGVGASSTVLECPSANQNFVEDWLAHKNDVADIGETHPDYQVLFSYLLPETPALYYLNQCLEPLHHFERSDGDLMHLQDWLSCINNYFSEPPELVQLLNRCFAP